MSDDKSKARGHDRTHVNVHDLHKQLGWPSNWDVSEQKGRDAVDILGLMTDDVDRELEKK